MKLTDKQAQKLVTFILSELKNQSIIQYKADEAKVVQRCLEIIKEDFRKEAALDAEVHKMMDD
ncbi:MAG: DUF507 family protein, partial [Bdellovibrionales bacterium]|nr:DUF507 family protein [Bdellovibrionales bacterium]